MAISSLKYRKAQSLKVWLNSGDMAKVREMVWKPRSREGKYSLKYITMVANGERNNSRIWEALWQVARENRERMERTENNIDELLKV